MKATGIVRRIDDLGRVVIPKEIRRTMRIREGDPLEIYTDKEGAVIFRKYSLMGGVADFAGQLCDSLWRNAGRPCIITDRDSCVAVAGLARKELAEKPVSQALDRLMEGRKSYEAQPGEERVLLCSDREDWVVLTAAPILSGGDVLGCVVLLAQPEDTVAGEVERKLTQTVAGFLGRHMED